MEVEAREVERSRRDSGLNINEFCTQLMGALGMEVPDAVAARLSPDDPARFVRALAVYTRAQRRKLVTLYRQAESLRESMSLDDTPSPVIGQTRIGSAAAADARIEMATVEELSRRSEQIIHDLQAATLAAEGARSLLESLDTALTAQLVDRRELVEQIDEQLRARQTALVSDILRADAKRLELDVSIGRLEALLESLHETLRPVAPASMA